MKTAQSKLVLPAIIMAMIFTAFALALVFENNTKVALGSTIMGNDYLSTTTAASTAYGTTITGDALIKTGSGSFGGFIVTGATAGIVNFYDATTTDVTKRTGNKATSSILITSLPASLAAGDYTGYDVTFSTGLYIDLVSGTMPTTTVKFRN